jgi:DHA2 family metal-tetracycline-proton antiporter-like MFS transporter
MGIYNLSNFLAGAVSGAVITKVVEFDWSTVNVTAIGMPTTFGAIYSLLAVLTLLTMVRVHQKVGRMERAGAQ